METIILSYRYIKKVRYYELPLIINYPYNALYSAVLEYGYNYK